MSPIVCLLEIRLTTCDLSIDTICIVLKNVRIEIQILCYDMCLSSCCLMYDLETLEEWKRKRNSLHAGGVNKYDLLIFPETMILDCHLT